MKQTPDIAGRKADHLELALGRSVEAIAGPGWEDVRLVHEALPEVNLDDVDLSVELLGRRLSAPLVVSGMTGGHEDAYALNAVLARASERHGLAMGLGSQRAALRDPGLVPTYSVAREQAPGAFLIANLGAAQLVDQPGEPALGLEAVQRTVDMIGADALALHLNFTEELVQTEGDRRARGCADTIAALARELDVPVIAKETGAGLSRRTALRLAELGVAALDVGGAGGTNFAIVERLRAERHGDERGTRLGDLLQDWGIPTAVSVVGAAASGIPVIATGGVRSGLDAAKALALGATAAGVGRPLLQAAREGDGAVDGWIERFLDELRSVLMLSGVTRPEALRAQPIVIGGQTRRWLDDLGYLCPERRQPRHGYFRAGGPA